ncbi:MAG: hypothetical protein JW759_10100, partial [Candidatus Coatesbacteria bacterium]|nr:hypothetical protein [Candidatus Coatesbacteria bacterium]
MNKAKPDQANVLERVKSLLLGGDSFEAVRYVNGLGEPLDVAKHYAGLVDSFYSKERSIPDMITMGRAGLQYCLTKADELADEAPEKAKSLKGVAKVISFNLAANAWPGWGEEGFVISRHDSVAGLDAAKLNLRMVKELNEGPVPLSVSHWAIGAQHIALGDYDKALEAFASSKKLAAEGDNKGGEWLAHGYTGITNILAGSKDMGQQELDEAIAGLDELDTDDAKFFIDQLKTVLKV